MSSDSFLCFLFEVSMKASVLLALFLDGWEWGFLENRHSGDARVKTFHKGAYQRGVHAASRDHLTSTHCHEVWFTSWFTRFTRGRSGVGSGAVCGNKEERQQRQQQRWQCDSEGPLCFRAWKCTKTALMSSSWREREVRFMWSLPRRWEGQHFTGVGEAVWKLLGLAQQGHTVLLPYLYSWVCGLRYPRYAHVRMCTCPSYSPMPVMSLRTVMSRTCLLMRKSAVVAAIIVVTAVAMWGMELYSPFCRNGTGGSRLIRIWISKFPEKKKNWENSSPVLNYVHA